MAQNIFPDTLGAKKLLAQTSGGIMLGGYQIPGTGGKLKSNVQGPVTSFDQIPGGVPARIV